MKKKYSKILLCMIMIVGLLYTPVAIPQLANTQIVAEAEAATVKLNKKKATVAVGNTVKLKMNGTSKKVKWSSNNKKVATVTSKGVVKGKKPGTATIKAKVAGKTYKCKVTVKKSIFVSKKTVNISKAGKTAKVNVTIRGKGKAINNSSNRAVATSKWSGNWKNGKNTLIITAKKPGTAYISLKNSFSKEVLKIKVVVPEPAPAPPAPAVYTITYELNKGVNAAANPATYTAGTAVTLADPSREHYDFAGWYLDGNFVTPFGGITEDTTGNLTLYAKWEKTVPDLNDSAYADMVQVKPENVRKAQAYVDQMYLDNQEVKPLTGNFTWQLAPGKPSWIYYTGLVHEGMMQLNAAKYSPEVEEFYTAHIKEDGSIRNYVLGTLDAALPAVNMISLLEGETLTAEEKTQYRKAVNYVYNQLENQTVYEDAGRLMLHTQESNGEPRAGWTKWNICLDGIYMSQLFLIRTAEAIDEGLLTITSKDGRVVTSEEIWNDIYSRLRFVMEEMRDDETGMTYHGYSVTDKVTNGAYWTRGTGWFAMVLMEAAEKMPNPEKKAVLTDDYVQLMDAVRQWQDPATGLWYNVTDHREEVTITKDGETIVNKPESSGSSMLAYALLRGYHSGLLQDESYRKAGLFAFNGLVETKLTAEGLTDHIHSSAVHENPSMYQISKYMTNDGKGVGPFIMALKYVY